MKNDDDHLLIVDCRGCCLCYAVLSIKWPSNKVPAPVTKWVWNSISVTVKLRSPQSSPVAVTVSSSSSMKIQWTRTDPTEYQPDQIIQSENLCLHQISKIVNKFWENDSLLFIRRHFHKEFTFLQKLDKFSYSFSINATKTILSELVWCRDLLFKHLKMN